MWLTLVLIVLGGSLLWLLFICIYGRCLLRKISKDSLIIFGKKGKGKTLLFSEMTRMSKKGYLSTTDFRHKGQMLINYGDVNVSPNNWENVLNDDIKPIVQKDWEGKPIFLDDAGVYLPNFADGMLKKRYDSMPIAYAVWRHLYNAPIHINSQDVSRAWKMVREQADGFVKVRGCIRLFGLAWVRCTYYDRIASAEAQLSPMHGRIFNKFSKAEVDNFVAMNGEIRNFVVFAPAWRNRYDSRYFKSVFFKQKTPSV